MNILFDHQIFSRQKFGGISKYFIHLYRHLNRLDQCSAKIIYKYANNAYLKDEFGQCNGFLPKLNFRGKFRLMDRFNRAHFKKKFDKDRVDLFHPTYYDPYFKPLIAGVPFVLTVFDMIHERLFPERKTPVLKWKAQLIEEAAVVITISDSTKNDLIDIMGINADKIETVHLGGALSSQRPLEMTLPDNYLLFIGDRKYYKNFSALLDVFPEVVKKNPDLVLLSIGGGPFDPNELKLIDHYQLSENVIQLDVEEGQLLEVYKRACLFVSTSRYEGFGLPVIEAFHAKCPTLLSDIPVYREVAGDGAMFFDLQDRDSLLNSLLTMMDSEDLKASFVNKASRIASGFSWEKCAEHTCQIYQSLCR